MRTTRFCGSWGVVPEGGMVSGGSMVPWGVGYVERCNPPRGEQTDTCKNIAFPRLRLRAVIVPLHWRIQFLSFSCSFRQKSCQIIGFCAKLRGWRPRLGNPGSTTAVLCYFPSSMNFLIIDVNHKCSFPRKKFTRCRTLVYIFFNFSWTSWLPKKKKSYVYRM